MSTIELFTAKSITFNYDKMADRICLVLGDARSEHFHHAWLTRRYLQQLLPQVAGWLDARCPLIEEGALPLTTAQKSKVAAFEHNSATQQVKTQKGPLPDAQAKQIDQSYLLKGIELSEKGGLVTLVFVEAKSKPVSGMRMSRNELHKLLSCLLELGNRGGWGLSSPWESSTVTIPGTFQSARH